MFHIPAHLNSKSPAAQFAPKARPDLVKIANSIKAIGLTQDALTAYDTFDYQGMVYIARIALGADRDFSLTLGQIDGLWSLLAA